MTDDWVYDEETYPNWFQVQFFHTGTGALEVFELSDRRDDLDALLVFLDEHRRSSVVRHVGFNNIGFDYPILHEVMTSGGAGITAYSRWQRADSIINGPRQWGVKPWEVLIPQVDLMRVHHLDNRAKRTGLKQLQFAMRAPSVEDLPFPPGTWLTREQMAVGTRYCTHDVLETYRFWLHSLPLVEFRDALSERYGYDASNFSDKKIGTDHFVKRLEERAPGSCYRYVEGRRQPCQTVHPGGIALRDRIFPWIRFDHPELARVLEHLRRSVVDEERVKGFFSKKAVDEHGQPLVVASLGGLRLAFGLGGVHGSVEGRTVREDAEHCLVDVDVSGYYPALAAAYGLHPAHLGPLFVEVLRELTAERRTHKKGTAPNQMLKLAGNGGGFGDTGNEFSPLRDVGYMLAVTTNGQLLLCMLVEQLARVPSVELVQVNTDGATLRVRRDRLADVRALCAWWQGMTSLELEEKFYSAMFVRDVNAYLAVGIDGKVKRKGPFRHVVGYNLGDGELAWHQDHSELVVAKAAEAYLLRGEPVDRFVRARADPFDFMSLAKAGQGARLELDGGEAWGSLPLSKSVRYFVSRSGLPLVKVMRPPDGCAVGDYKLARGVDPTYARQVLAELPPRTWDARVHQKNQAKHEERRVGVAAGYRVTECNRAERFDWADLDHDYYVTQAQALVASVGGGEFR